MAIIGIDLGASAIKLALFEGRLGRYQLAGYRQAPVPQDAEGSPDLDVRLDTLANLLDSVPEGWKSTHGVAFPADHVSLRCIDLPFRDRAQIAKTLPFEVESLLPFDLEDMVMTSRMLTSEGRGSRVLAAVTPRERVSLLLRSLEAQGIEARALPVDIDLLSGFADEGVQAIVDFGHSRTLVALSLDKKVQIARAISSGGRALTLALAEHAECSWSDAEDLKHQLHLGAPPEVATVEWEEPVSDVVAEPPRGETLAPEVAVLRKALNPLVQEIRATLIQFEDAHSLQISEVLITGGGASLGGLSDWLAASLGVRVTEIDVPEASLETSPGRFAICHALGLRGHQASLPAQLLNLRQGEFSFTGNLARVSRIIGFVAAGLLVFFLGSLALHFQEMGELNEALEAADARVSSAVTTAFPDVSADKAANLAQAQAIVNERAAAVEQRTEQLQGLIPDRPPILSLLKQLSLGMPTATEARVDVTELHVVPGSVTLKLETDEYSNAEAIERKLKEEPRFSQTKRSKEQKVSNGIRFVLTIPLSDDNSGEEG
jgi:general secretion pathway protein L